MTIEEEIAELTEATNALLAAINVRRSYLDGLQAAVEASAADALALYPHAAALSAAVSATSQAVEDALIGRSDALAARDAAIAARDAAVDAMDSKEPLITALPIAKGGTGSQTASAARMNLGLGNVDNTSDANKPVSTAQATALAGKEPAITALPIAKGGTGSQTASAARMNLGLGNVDNTSDANKPVSTAQAAALAAKSNASNPVTSGSLYHVGSATIQGGRTYAAGDASHYSLGLFHSSARLSSGDAVFVGATDSSAPSLVFSRKNGDALAFLDNDGRLSIVKGPMGYAGGAGGTVTQPTSKSTSVALHKPCGRIWMHDAPLGAGVTVAFTFNNSLLAEGDLLVVAPIGAHSAYSVRAYAYIGAAAVFVKNESAGSLSDAVALNFFLLKGATA